MRLKLNQITNIGLVLKPYKLIRKFFNSIIIKLVNYYLIKSLI